MSKSFENSGDVKPINVAIVGCGTVGSAVAEILLTSKKMNTDPVAGQLDLAYVVERNIPRAIEAGVPEELCTADYDAVLADSELGVVIELIGGTTIAREVIIQALNAGKHVVTANKALLAHHGAELFSLAREKGVSLAFEASCVGAVPIIRALTDGLMANSMDALFGIVNGTSNFILTEMLTKGSSYAEALKSAQDDGLAEADPSLDVNGSDSAHKIAIMGALAFGVSVDFSQISISGIDTLDKRDILFGQEMGYRLKLIASAIRSPRGIFMRVEPAFISPEHPLAWVKGSFNAVSVYGNYAGHSMYYGRGAGGLPTASAVVSDLLSISTGSYPRIFKTLGNLPGMTPREDLLHPDQIRRRYYIRLLLDDAKGVLSSVTSTLAAKNISVSSILQHEAPEPETTRRTAPQLVPLVLTTHRSKESDVTSALEAIRSLQGVENEYELLPIIDEHPEYMASVDPSFWL